MSVWTFIKSFFMNKTDTLKCKCNNGIKDRDEFINIIKMYLEEDDNRKLLKQKINKLLK